MEKWIIKKLGTTCFLLIMFIPMGLMFVFDAIELGEWNPVLAIIQIIIIWGWAMRGCNL